MSMMDLERAMGLADRALVGDAPDLALRTLAAALQSERDLADRLAAELAKHGWGDMHYGNARFQDPAICALILEHAVSRRAGAPA